MRYIYRPSLQFVTVPIQVVPLQVRYQVSWE